jgi:hypothetical protein
MKIRDNAIVLHDRHGRIYDEAYSAYEHGRRKRSAEAEAAAYVSITGERSGKNAEAAPYVSMAEEECKEEWRQQHSEHRQKSQCKERQHSCEHGRHKSKCKNVKESILRLGRVCSPKSPPHPTAPTPHIQRTTQHQLSYHGVICIV